MGSVKISDKSCEQTAEDDKLQALSIGLVVGVGHNITLAGRRAPARHLPGYTGSLGVSRADTLYCGRYGRFENATSETGQDRP
jgi:hypothetical protein